MTRPTFDEIAFELTRTIAKRSTCPRLHTATLIVTKDNRLIASGYNGSLPGQQHCEQPMPCKACDGKGYNYVPTDRDDNIEDCLRCDRTGIYIAARCLMIDGHCQRTVHAEANALAQAAKYGTSTNGCKMYMLHLPCITCAKLMLSSGIDHLIVFNEYDNQDKDEGLSLIISTNTLVEFKPYIASQIH